MEHMKKTLDQQFMEQTGIDVSKKVRGVDLDPVIGMGVTRSINGDSYPYTIIVIYMNMIHILLLLVAEKKKT